MQIIVRICDVVKRSLNQIRILRMKIDIKIKWRIHVKSIIKKMIIQTLTLSRFEKNARLLRIVNTSSRNRFRVDQIWVHSFDENSRKFDMQTIVRICDVVKQSFNQIRVLRMQINFKLKWRIYVKNIQKKWSLKRWRCRVSSFSFEKRVLSKHDWFIWRSYNQL